MIQELNEWVADIDNNVSGAGQVMLTCRGRLFGIYGWNLRLDITRSQDFWSNIKLSDNTVILSETENSDGTLTRTFGLLTKNSEGYDRFGFYVPDYLEESCNDIALSRFYTNVKYLNANDYNIADYTVFSNPSPAPDCNPQYTDGSQIDENTENDRKAIVAAEEASR